MTERRRRLKRRDKRFDPDEKPTKQELAVAKHLRFKCPSKTSVIFNDNVSYFSGSKAVDVLLDSRWASDKKELLFTNRQSCVNFMQDLLDRGFFFRARKLVPKRREPQDSKAGLLEKTKSADDSEATPRAKKKTETADKKAKRIKLQLHSDQLFIDGNDIYVWKYNPTAPKTFLLGLLMVVGTALVCLFPLWPANVRVAVYYVSLLAVAFIPIFLTLVVVRTIVFWSLWIITFGKHNFWLLPNLTEDCGFFESFKPLYTYTIHVTKDETKDTDEIRDKNEGATAGRDSDSSGLCPSVPEQFDPATASNSSNSSDDEDAELNPVSSVSEFEMVEKPAD